MLTRDDTGTHSLCHDRQTSFFKNDVFSQWPFVLVSKVPSVPLLVLNGLLSRKTDDRTLLLNDRSPNTLQLYLSS